MQQYDVPIILVGMSYRTAPVEMRGRLTSAKTLLISGLQSATAAIRESVVVSTCNRLEIYVGAENMAGAKARIDQVLRAALQDSFEPIRSCLYTVQGGDAVRHLMRVAAGLESRVLGETQILGQVSSAYREASDAGTVGWLLSRVFANAIHTGRTARSTTEISRFPTSMSHVVATTLKSRLRGLNGRKVLLIGAGEMVKLAAQILPRHGGVELAFLNRTAEKAAAIAAKYRGTVFPWDDLPAALAWADAVIAATAAPEPVVRVRDMSLRLSSQTTEPLLIVDMAVVRNVDPDVSRLPHVQLVGVDELDSSLDEKVERRKAAVPELERLIENNVERLVSWYRSRHISPVIADLRRKMEQVADSELEMALRGLEHLGPDQRQTIQRLIYRVTNKLLHEPTVRLRSAGEAAQDYGQVVRHLFALGEADGASNRFQEGRRL